jgi:hypothetical protein
MCKGHKDGLLSSQKKQETDSDIEIIFTKKEVDIASSDSSYSDDSDLEIVSTNIVRSR